MYTLGMALPWPRAILVLLLNNQNLKEKHHWDEIHDVNSRLLLCQSGFKRVSSSKNKY